MQNQWVGMSALMIAGGKHKLIPCDNWMRQSVCKAYSGITILTTINGKILEKTHASSFTVPSLHSSCVICLLNGAKFVFLRDLLRTTKQLTLFMMGTAHVHVHPWLIRYLV